MASKNKVTEVIAGMDIDGIADFLYSFFVGMDAQNKTRTYMSLGRDIMQADWFSARGVQQKFDINFRTFLLEDFYNPKSSKYIEKTIAAPQIRDYAVAVAMELVHLKSNQPEIFKQILDRAVQEFDNGVEMENAIIALLVGYQPGAAVEEEEPEIVQTLPPLPETPDGNMPPVEEKKEETVVVTSSRSSKPKPAGKEKPAPAAPAEEKVYVQTEIPHEKLPAPPGPAGGIHDGQASAIIKETEDGLDLSISFNLPIKQLIKRHLGGAVTAGKTIIIGDRKPVTIAKRTHAAYEDALAVTVSEKQSFFSGPAGSGKTSLGEDIAAALQLPFGHISCTAGMSEAHLLGRMTATGEYLPAQFVTIFEQGGVYLIDEVDAGDPNTLLIINSALANGYLSVPNRIENPTAMRHKDFYCICSANTWGYGSNEYIGRNSLDAAFLDRFVGSKVQVDYDIELEREISQDHPEAAVFFWALRKMVEDNRIRRVVSTRALAACIRALAAGRSLDQFKARFFVGWTNEELGKVGYKTK